WNVPTVSAAGTRVLQARARDSHGNQRQASLTVTVAPPSTARPYVQLEALSPSNVTEGTWVTVRARVHSEVAITSVRLGLGSEAVTLSQPPWEASLRAPRVPPPFQRVAVRASAVDRLGRESVPSQFEVTILDDGRLPGPAALDMNPEGPALLGGSTLQVGAQDGGVPVGFAVHVNEVPLPPGATGVYTLPLGPEAAPVRVSARMDAFDGGVFPVERQGALTAFASGPAVSTPAAEEPVVDLATQGAWVLVARDLSGGHTRLELRNAATQALTAERSLQGTAVAVAFERGRAVVALRASGRGRVELLSVPSLETVDSFSLRRSPRALEAIPSGLAVGTDEGLELWSSDGQLASRLPLGEVLGVSADGAHLSVLSGGTLHEVDASVPHAPALVASAPADAAVGVAALAGGRRCVVGATARCFLLDGAALTLRGEARLPGAALAAEGPGPWLLAGTANGLSVVDAREVPATAGYYPGLAGKVAMGEGRIVSAEPGRVSRMGLRRSMGAPTVHLELPPSAAPGARVPVVASVQGLSDPRDGYTAELRVQGTVVQVLKGRLPEFVDLPSGGASAQVALRVVDLAGHEALAQATVTLEDDGTGPALAALQTWTEVPSGATFPVAAVPTDPARVAAVEYTLDGTVLGLAEAPMLSWRPRAPVVSADTAVTVSAVALDTQGRRGAPVQAMVWVRAATGTAAPTVTLARVGSGPILEGTAVRVRATLTPPTPGTEVRFRVDGEEQQRLGFAPYEAVLRMPVGTGSRGITVEAVAVDAQGRESAAALLPLTVVDDLTPPVVSLTVDPSGAVVTAGGRVRATATATDAGELESWSIKALLANAELASGGGRLEFTVPASTPVGTALEIVATARDEAGNVAVSRVTRAVVAPVLPEPGIVVAGIFAGAERLMLRGDLVYATTPGGLAVGRLRRGASPTIEPVGFLATELAPTSLAVRGEWAVLVLPGQGLRVVNVADPAQPQMRGAIAGHFASVVAGDRFYARAAAMSEYLYELDLEQPSAPVLKSYAYSTEPATEGTADGVAYNYYYGLAVSARLSNGQHGQLSLTNPQGILRTARWNDRRLLVGTDRSLAVLVRQGDSLGLAQELPLPAGVRAMAVADGLAWLSCTDDKVRWVDVRNPGAAQVIATESFPARAIEVSGGLLLATTAEGISVRRLPPSGATGSALSTPLGSLALDDAPRTLAPFRRGVLVAAGLAGVQRVAVDDPAHPVRVSQPVTGLSLKQVERMGEQVFTLNGTTLAGYVEQVSGTLSYDSTASTRLAALGNVERFTVSPRRLWAVSGGAVSSVGLPAVEQQVSLLLGLATLDVAGDEAKAVVALGRAGAAVVQVDAAGTLRQGALIPAVHTDAVAVDGTLALLGGPSGLAVVDLSVPSAPVLRASLPTAGPVRRVRLTGRLALVSEGAAGVELWNVSQPDAPVLLGRLSAPRADDAVVAAGHIVVADGLSGVKVFSLPAGAVSPSARLLPAASTVEAGAWVELSSRVAGAGVDTAELLMDGQVLGRLDEGTAPGRYRVPLQAPIGRTLAFQVKARTAAGAETLSAPHLVRVSAPSNLPELSLSMSYPYSGNAYHSGAVAYVAANFSGAVAPVTASVRWAGQDLGMLAPYYGYRVEGYVRLPVVAADTAAPLEVVLMDAAGRTQTASVSITVLKLPTSLPSNVSGLPTVLYGPPYLNTFRIDAYCYSDCTLRLERNGVTVASNATAGSGWQYAYPSFVLPEEVVGTQQTLVAIAEDAAGRQTRLEKTYTVLRDDLAPTVYFSYLPTSAVEGSTWTISVSPSFPPGHQIRSLRLLVNGAEHASTMTSGTWNVSYTFPSASVGPVLFEAIATDHLGREGRAQRTVTVVPDVPPTVSTYIWPTNTRLVVGQPYTACISMSDDVRVASARLRVGTEQLWSCNGDCWSRCFSQTTPNVSELVLSAEATDSRGQTRTVSTAYPVVPDLPPQVQVRATPEPLFGGRPFRVCYTATDELGVSSVKLKLNGAEVWNCSGSSCAASYESCPVRRPSPSGSSLQVTVEATDTTGQHSQSTQTYEVGVDQEPPVASFQNTQYLPVFMIAGTEVSMSVDFSDNSHLQAYDFRADGTILQQWQSTGDYNTTTAQAVAYYTPATAGTTLVTAQVTDGAGLQSTAQRSVQVFPPGTGTCSQPLPSWLGLPGKPIYAPGASTYCGGSGAWYQLPFDGPVNRIRLERPGAYYFYGFEIADGCAGGAQAYCAWPDHVLRYDVLEAGPLSADARVFVASNYPYSFPTIVWARLGTGALCDVNSTHIVCEYGSCLEQDDGQYRCVPSACNDGVDNDGDGSVDFPQEPGCTERGDNDEQDPPVPPACSNGLDDDGDGRVDWPADPYCLGRGQLAEDGLGDSCVEPRELRALTQLSFAGAADDLSLSCQPTAAKPDQVMSFTLQTYAHSFSLQSRGLTGIALQKSCSNPATTEFCYDGSYTLNWWSNLQPGTYFLIAEGTGEAFIRPDASLGWGAPCDPAVSWLHCMFPEACLPAAGGGSACRTPACANSSDDDGDGQVDHPTDPGCASRNDDDETDPPVLPECANGVDDDLDGLHDYPADPGCASRAGLTEQGSGESCAEPLQLTASQVHLPLGSSLDDELLTCDRMTRRDRVLSLSIPSWGYLRASGVGLTGIALRSQCAHERSDVVCSAPLGQEAYAINTHVDRGTHFLIAEGPVDTDLNVSFIIYGGAPCDPAISWASCHYPYSCLPSPVPDGPGAFWCQAPACANGRDDDGDGLDNYPFDPGCTSPTDVDEADPAEAPACANGADDDGDGLTDWPSELGCANQNDTDEADPAEPPQCSNGEDDDGDGQIDFGADAECSSAGSDNEGLFRGVLMKHLPSEPLPVQVSFQATSREPMMECFQSNRARKQTF
ncbi:MAG TPA: hypothetical protein VF815_16855, partial [Myxococcaceae bacterium]